MTNNNEWIEKQVKIMCKYFGWEAESEQALELRNAFRDCERDCQRKTLEMVLPEDRGNFDLGEKDPYLSGFTDCRSEVLRRASEAGINIEGL